MKLQPLIGTVMALSLIAPIGLANNAMPISPGAALQILHTGDSCPTFSWSTDDLAQSYQLHIFLANNSDPELQDNLSVPAELDYQQRLALAEPIIEQTIPGQALSWTPAAGNCLSPDLNYAWYVQGVDDNDLGGWSAAHYFRVNSQVTATLMDKAIQSSLSSHLNIEDDSSTQALVSVFNQASLDEAKRLNNFILESRTPRITTSSHLIDSPVVRNANEGDAYIGSTYYGTHAGDSLFYYAADNSFFGTSAGRKTTSGHHNTFLGRSAGYYNTTGYHNTFLGAATGSHNTTGNANTFSGSWAGFSNTTGSSNTFSGENAGTYNITGYHNTFLGRHAGSNNTTGNYNTFSGSYAGYRNTTGSDNTFSGKDTGFYNSTGYRNTFSGSRAGQFNTTGSFNTFSGSKAGYRNTTGSYNSFSGIGAGFSNTTGSYNSFLGTDAGSSNTTGSFNTFSGVFAGYGNTTGYNNTSLGSYAGYYNTTGRRNIFLGYMAGFHETGSDRLYIENSTSSSPLIYGDFAADIVVVNGRLGIGTHTPTAILDVRSSTDTHPLMRLTNAGPSRFHLTNSTKTITGNETDTWALNSNGTFKITAVGVQGAQFLLDTTGNLSIPGTLSQGSDVNSKENFQAIDGQEVLDHIANLPITTWNYKKDATDIRHLGPMAQDFYAAFKLGATETGIASLDSEGIALAGIQQLNKNLREQVRELKNNNQDLQARMAKLENLVEKLARNSYADQTLAFADSK